MRVTVKYHVNPGFIRGEDCEFAQRWLGEESQVTLFSDVNNLLVTQALGDWSTPTPESALEQVLKNVRTLFGRLAPMSFVSCSIEA